MAMRRKRMYVLRVNVLDTLHVDVKISEKEYKEIMESLRRQVAQTHIDPEMESTFVAEDTETMEEFTTNINRIYRATLGTTDIELEKSECKEGYIFRK